MNNIIHFPSFPIEWKSKTVEGKGPSQTVYIQTKYDLDDKPLKTNPDDLIATTTIFQEDGTIISERFNFIDGRHVMWMYRNGKLFKKIEL